MIRTTLSLRFLLPLVVAASLLLCGFWVYRHAVQQELRENINATLEGIGEQGTLSLQAVITGHLRLIRHVAQHAGPVFLQNHEKGAERLAYAAAVYGYKRMSFLLADGTCVTSDRVKIPLQRMGLDAALEGKDLVTDTLFDRTDGLPINIYAVPLMQDGKIVGALTATRSHEDFRKHLSLQFWKNQAKALVINSEGKIIVMPENGIDSILPSDNFFEKLRQNSRNEAAIVSLQSMLAEKKRGTVLLHAPQGGKSDARYVYAMPTGINDWYMMTVFPAELIEERLQTIMNHTVALGLLLLLCFGVLAALVIHTMKRNADVLRRIAFVDAITQGNTFIRFMNLAQIALEQEDHATWAVISLDIDNFKLVNTLLGSETGTKTLCDIHNTLEAWARKNQGISGRQSGDIFVAFVPFHGQAEMEAALKELCASIIAIQVDSDDTYRMSPSIGVCLLDKTNTEPRRLENKVDCSTLARKTVKGKHDKLYAFFDAEMQLAIIRNKTIENRMVEALACGEFEVYFQPKYDAQTERLAGAEALVRWRTADGNFVSPGSFIPLFESNGFILNLDRYIFSCTCRLIRQWRSQGLVIPPVSINISRLHLHDPLFVENYIKTMRGYDIDGSQIQLEITESAFFEDENLLSGAIAQFHAHGVKILMDDFGTGYSSMSMLKSLDMDGIKLDKSFLSDVGSARSENIIKSLVTLCHSLGMETTMEGVETEDQVKFVRSIGTNLIQGFYFSRPINAEAFAELLRS